MPVRCSVVMPSLGLFPVQINPHYIDATIGWTYRAKLEMSVIAEFCAINPDEIVVAIREGSYLYIQGEGVRYYSAKIEGFKIFQLGKLFQNSLIQKMLAKWVLHFAVYNSGICNLI